MERLFTACWGHVEIHSSFVLRRLLHCLLEDHPSHHGDVYFYIKGSTAA